MFSRTDFSDAKTFRANHGKVNYTEADKACRSNDHRSHLAKIQTIEDLQLSKNISNTTNGIKYWTSLNIWWVELTMAYLRNFVQSFITIYARWFDNSMNELSIFCIFSSLLFFSWH